MTVTAEYAVADGSLIRATLDGQTLFVPADPGNRIYRRLQDEGVTIAPYVAPAPDLPALIADKRWRVETAGIAVEIDGQTLQIDTDDRSKVLLLGARDLAEADAGATFTFAARNGRFVLTAAQLLALDATVKAHVQATFAAAAQIADELDAGTPLDAAAIETHPAWPPGL
jgi:hypothetical protein